jgi:hypothetical protein
MTTTLGKPTPYYGQPVNCGTFTNITSTTTGTLIKGGEGALYSISFNSPAATGVITIYDGLSTSGVVIATITVPASPQPFTWGPNPGGIYFTTGLYVVVATAAQDLTVFYK